jgi:hypothetical protein
VLLCVIVLVLEVFFIGCLVYAMVEYIANRDKFAESIEDVYGANLSVLFLVLICVFLLVNLLPLLAISNLLLFHVWLWK